MKSAHLPPDFRAERVDRWLTHRWVEQLETALLKRECEGIFAGLREQVLHKEDGFESLAPVSEADGLASVAEARDPVPEALAPRLVALDEQLEALGNTLAELQELRLSEAVNGAGEQWAAALAIVRGLHAELANSAGAAGRPEPAVGTRAAFIEHWADLEGSAARRANVRAAWSALADHFAAARTVHPRRARRAELEALLEAAARELGQLAEATESLAWSGPERVKDWPAWAWARDGAELEELIVTLRAVAPALAGLVEKAALGSEIVWPPSEPGVGASAEKPPAEVPPEEVAAERPAAASTPPVAAEWGPPLRPSASPVEALDLFRNLPSPSPVLSGRIQGPVLNPAEAGTAVAPAAAPLRQRRSTPLSAPVSAAPDIPPALLSGPATKISGSDGPAGATRELPALPPAPSAKAGGSDGSADSRAESPACSPLWASQRFGLAAHLAAAHAGSERWVPAWVLRIGALGPAVRTESGPLAASLATEIASFSREALRQRDRATDRAARLLLAAALIRPAIHAPATGAAAVLGQLELEGEPGLREIHATCAAVARFGNHGLGLTPAALGVAGEISTLTERREALATEYADWQKEAREARLRYVPARLIWHDWLGMNGGEGALRQTLDAVFASRPGAAADLAGWEGNPAVNARVQEGMLRYGKGQTMEGTALHRMQNMLERAMQIARRRLTLEAHAASSPDDFLRQRVAEFMAHLHPHLSEALAECEALGRDSDDERMRGAAWLLHGQFRELEPLLAGRELPVASEPAPADALHAELLRAPELSLDENLEPRNPATIPLGVLERLAAEDPPQWCAAWQAQCAADNHFATARLLEFFDRSPQAGCDPERLRHERDGLVATARLGLEEGIKRAIGQINIGARLGYCTVRELQDWQSQLHSLRELAEKDLDFAWHQRELTAIASQLKQRKAEAVALARSRLTTLRPNAGDTARVEEVLSQGDVQTAHDYLERLAGKRPLPETSLPEVDALASFAGPSGWMERAPEALKQVSGQQLQAALRKGGTWQGLDFSPLHAGDAVEGAAALVGVWFELQQSQKLTEEALTRLFGGFGFQIKSARSGGTAIGAAIVERGSIFTEPVSNREICPVAAFGSRARGEYSITAIWGRPDVDDLFEMARTANVPVGGAHFVLYFGVLTSTARRRLARRAREKRGFFLVIDDALLVQLAAQARGRLAMLFACALPFALVEPYAHTGEVPQEMFYGRGREFDSLLDPTGACLVFGGRQLGKSALLQAVRTEFHRPTAQRFAHYLDLAKDIFLLGKPAEHLWSLLVEQWKADGIVPEKTPANTGLQRVLELVRTWLDGDPQRRILLLLDEADKFFEADAQPTQAGAEPYSRCALLRGAMRETHGRLKVVFAGLHNVQRTSRQSNSPLWHFGQPICIGPMLNAGEATAAQQLIEWPLAAAGYRFASPDLPARILALTNYYPSLVQLVGSCLLAHLHECHKSLFDWQKTPPCTIEDRHLEEVFTQQNLHAQMRHHFLLTLDLDRRYRVIAYRLAYLRFLEDRDEGYESEELRADLLREWPAGFKESGDPDHFRALLEEMTGLGILRQVGLTSRFALRNPNVVTLLGSVADIEGELDELKNLEPEPAYDARTFRRLGSERRDPVSPLTTEQEGMIGRKESLVAVIQGSAASGLAQVGAALTSRNHGWLALLDRAAVQDDRTPFR